MNSSRSLSDQYNTCHIWTAGNLDHHLYCISANAPGKFVPGACADKVYRQAVTRSHLKIVFGSEPEEFSGQPRRETRA